MREWGWKWGEESRGGERERLVLFFFYSELAPLLRKEHAMHLKVSGNAVLASYLSADFNRFQCVSSELRSFGILLMSNH